MPNPATVAASVAALAAAPLYLAPFLAGLAAAPAAMIPVFVAVWAIWLMLMRPRHWGRRAMPGLALGGLWLAVLAQGLLIVAIFATGRGLAVLNAQALAMPAWLPAALALLALPLGLRLSRAPAAPAPPLDAADDPADQGVSAGSGA